MQCPDCSGNGWNFSMCDAKERCATCNGTGNIRPRNTKEEPCPKCEGEGEGLTPADTKYVCDACNGTGRYSVYIHKKNLLVR